MKILLLATFLLLLAACNSTPPPPTALEAAENDLMDRHDAAMQQTGQLFELKHKIGRATPAAMPYLHGLQAADNAMMAWMNHYQPDTTAAEAQRMAYFRQQQAALAAVERQLRGTIDSATAFVAQHPAAH